VKGGCVPIHDELRLLATPVESRRLRPVKRFLLPFGKVPAELLNHLELLEQHRQRHALQRVAEHGEGYGPLVEVRGPHELVPELLLVRREALPDLGKVPDVPGVSLICCRNCSARAGRLVNAISAPQKNLEFSSCKTGLPFD
jgi:hypothetical protein